MAPPNQELHGFGRMIAYINLFMDMIAHCNFFVWDRGVLLQRPMVLGV